MDFQKEVCVDIHHRNKHHFPPALLDNLNETDFSLTIILKYAV